jgi:hypothetical protein
MVFAWATCPCLALAQQPEPAPSPATANTPAAAAPAPAEVPPAAVPAAESGLDPNAQVSPSYPPPAAASATLQPSSVPEDTFSSTYDNNSEVRPGRVAGFMGWAFNMPLGSVRDFATNVSPLGFELQFNGWITKNFSLGVSGEWATYVDDRPRSTITLDRGAVTATAYNSVQTAAARLLVHYMFSAGPVRPYIGPHVGVSWSSFDSEAADLVLSDTQVSVNFGGEAGMEIPFGRYAPVGLVNLRYSDSPAAEFRNSVTNVQSLALLLGVGF